MADWLIEEGIGESRAIQLSGETIIAARIEWPGALAAGLVEDAVLVSRQAGSKRGTIRFANGQQALADRLPAAASEGAALRMEVTRAALAETGRHKLAQARATTSAPRPAPTLAERLHSEGHEARRVHHFPRCDWDELIGEAQVGEVEFAHGQLVISPTPAMTLIDIDGTLPPRELALAAVPAIASALARFDLAGSIGMDFPTLADKSDRRAVDVALAAALDRWPHERTAMNGFGFVQLVARLERASLIHRLALDPAGAAARMLLRRAERVQEPGVLLLTVHPTVRAAVTSEWEAELARRIGRPVRWQVDPALAPGSGFAQAISP
ncbi:MAG: ribonuclease [Novosphingobium sp.]